jgi:hypothetical protein
MGPHAHVDDSQSYIIWTRAISALLQQTVGMFAISKIQGVNGLFVLSNYFFQLIFFEKALTHLLALQQPLASKEFAD